MRAMILSEIAALRDNPAPLALVDLPIPEPAGDQILIQVTACGVCHTELDEIEGRAAPARLPIVLGHEVVGRVAATGPRVDRHQVDDRVGVGWIYDSTGAEDENLDPAFRATGRDADGGYAEYMVVGQNYAYPIPAAFSDVEAAPLLCAGAIGYRALRLTGLHDGQSLGLMGFGGSAHLVLQMVRRRFPCSPVFVFARDAIERDFSQSLGAVWAGDIADRAPQALDAIIDTTPVWQPVVESLANLRPGGRLVINAIRKEDVDQACLLRLSYHDHLWMEREIKTVANITRRDICDFLQLAAEISLRPEVAIYPLEAANEALVALREGTIRGAKVLSMATAGTTS